MAAMDHHFRVMFQNLILLNNNLGNSVKKAVNITGNERPVKSKDSNVSSTRSKR